MNRFCIFVILFCTAMNFLALPSNAGLIKDALNKLDVNSLDMSFRDIIEGQFIGSIEEEDAESVKARTIIENQTSGGDTDISGRLQFLDSMKSQKSIDYEETNYTTRYLVHNFKASHGNYSKLTISIFSNIKKEDWFVPRSSVDARFCESLTSEIIEILGIPDTNRDMLRDSFPEYGVKFDNIEAQWSSNDISIKFDCNSTQSNSFGDYKIIHDPSPELVLSVQKALNYFGFNAGKADGVMGKKTGEGIKAFSECLDRIPSTNFREAEIDYLLGSYENIKARKSSGNCEDLREDQPVQAIFNWTTIDIVPKSKAEKLLPIIWLACTKEKTRKQIFISGGTDETINEMALVVYGVDLAEKKIIGESKGTVSDTVKITDTMINFSKEHEPRNKIADFVVHTGRINRISGAFLEMWEFTKNGTLESKFTTSGTCDLMDATKRKF
jgi:hypothetical protein